MRGGSPTKKQHKVNFINLNKGSQSKPVRVYKPKESPTRLDQVLKTKVKPVDAAYTNGRPNSLYHDVLMKKAPVSRVEEPEHIYSKLSTPGKHNYLEGNIDYQMDQYPDEKEYEPLEAPPMDYPETVQVDLNNDQSYEIQQEIQVVGPQFDIRSSEKPTSPAVEVVEAPAVATKVFTDDQLQKFMDVSVKKNVDERMLDHKTIVMRELAKYRQTNLVQIENHF